MTCYIIKLRKTNSACRHAYNELMYFYADKVLYIMSTHLFDTTHTSFSFLHYFPTHGTLDKSHYAISLNYNPKKAI